MPNEPDYKTAYETLMKAVDDGLRMIERAQIMTTYQLRQQAGDLTEEDLESVKETDDWT